MQFHALFAWVIRLHVKKLLPLHSRTKTLLRMKLTCILFIGSILQASAGIFGQDVSLSFKNAPIQQVFKSIKKQTGFTFLADSDLLKKANKVSINVNNILLEDALKICFNHQPFGYSIAGKIISVKEINMIHELITPALPPPPIDVRGRVVNEKGEPVAGATVNIKGSKKGVSTSVDGSFVLTGNIGDILLISSIGYGSREIKIGGDNIGEINLIIANAELKEVVINKGYYQTKREVETGNVARVSSKEIGQQPVNNPLAALAGRVPGLEIAQRSGAPGSGFTVQIRGKSSLGQGYDPLYVIDGIQYPSQMPNSSGLVGEAGGGSLNANLQGGNPLNFINVADIESIDVLKDADATAIYGSRGAGGVILITTKKGKPGNTKIDINGYSGIGKATNFMKLMNTQQYLEMRREAFKNDGIDIPITPDVNNPDLTFWDENAYTDWQKVLFGKTAHYNDLQTSISGGSGSTTYKFGGAYHKESTVFISPGADRKLSANFSLNTKALKDKLRMNFTSMYTVDKNDVTPGDYTSRYILPPNTPAIYNADGTLNWAPITPGGEGTFVNPFGMLNQAYLGKTNALTSNILLSYAILPSLTLQVNSGYNTFRTDEVSTLPNTVFDPFLRPYIGSSATYLNSSNTSWMTEPQLTYNQSWGKFKFSGLVGGAFREERSNFSSARGEGYSDDNFLTNPFAARTYTRGTYFVKQYRYNAVYSRLNFNYNDKYLINLTGRRDGTSRFGPENQWANFGSVGLAWVFSNEDFLKYNLPWLSFGKLRSSYGTTGNDQIPDYLYYNLYANDAVSYGGIKGLTSGGLFNPYLQWEITKKFEAAIELGLFQDKLNVSVSYYRNRSGNQLANTILPQTAGYNSITTNLPALIENKGWEFTLQNNTIQNRDFKWSIIANLSIPKNKLVKFDNIDKTTFKNSYIIGEPISAIKVFRTDGIDPATGVLRILNKDGIVTPASLLMNPEDKTKVLNTAVLLSAGLQNNITYKSFELNFFFQFVKKNALANRAIFAGGPFNIIADYVNRWQKPGDVAKYYKVSQDFFNADAQWVGSYERAGLTDISWEDVSYIRLKNLSLSWSFPGAFVKKLGMNNLRVYGQGQNLLTFTRYTGFDPETLTTSLPPIKVFTLGFQTSF
jgi:TonB-dependent starch-binding outer membrane protein SusC